MTRDEESELEIMIDAAPARLAVLIDLYRERAIRAAVAEAYEDAAKVAEDNESETVAFFIRMRAKEVLKT